jgi:hypothetical protein
VFATWLALAAVAVPAAVASGGSTSHIRARWLSPITNHSRPNEVDKHFAGKPVATIPAGAIGYPDGTCWVYSNKSSWAVIKCAPRSPPDAQTSDGATTRVRAHRLSPITNTLAERGRQALRRQAPGNDPRQHDRLPRRDLLGLLEHVLLGRHQMLRRNQHRLTQ